jgi:hypothetical protein
MKKSILIMATSSFLLCFSCAKKKEDDCAEGIVRLSNLSSNLYVLIINGNVRKFVQVKEMYDLTLPTGKYQFEVVRITDKPNYPADKTDSVTVIGCKTVAWQFP